MFIRVAFDKKWCRQIKYKELCCESVGEYSPYKHPSRVNDLWCKNLSSDLIFICKAFSNATFGDAHYIILSILRVSKNFQTTGSWGLSFFFGLSF